MNNNECLKWLAPLNMNCSFKNELQWESSSVFSAQRSARGKAKLRRNTTPWFTSLTEGTQTIFAIF